MEEADLVLHVDVHLYGLAGVKELRPGLALHVFEKRGEHCADFFDAPIM